MPLNSWPFLVLAVCAILILPVTRGWIKTATFMTLNLIFVSTYWRPATLGVALSFCFLGYVCVQAIRTRSPRFLPVSVLALTGLFVFLRGYDVAGVMLGSSSDRQILAFAGLSFLFFKILHVVIDAAAGTIEQLSLGSYLNYCLNFTTVLMGPIQRYQDFITQWSGNKASMEAGFEAHIDATNRVLRGLVKAFVIAPFLQPYVLTPGLQVESMRVVDLLVRIYAFYIFLYFDFSGYCDLMIGIGALMGIRPPENFDLPFLARNVTSYWLRVHRSLTLWLTDYVFTPSYRVALRSRLGSHTFVALAGSLLLTMFVAGVWHGTTLNFVVFGLIHGAAFVVARGYELGMVRWLGRARFRRLAERPHISAAAVILTYNFTSLAYTFFVLDVHEAFRVIERLTMAAREVIL